jgi:hypothetical protein
MSQKYNNRYCQEIYKLIEPLLGDLMTQNILKFQIKKIGKIEDTIEASDLPTIAEAIKSGLTIFLGSEASGNVAERISKIL